MPDRPPLAACSSPSRDARQHRTGGGHPAATPGCSPWPRSPASFSRRSTSSYTSMASSSKRRLLSCSGTRGGHINVRPGGVAGTEPPPQAWPRSPLTACSFFFAALASSERSRLWGAWGGDTNWGLFLLFLTKTLPRCAPDTPGLGGGFAEQGEGLAGRHGAGGRGGTGRAGPPPTWVPPAGLRRAPGAAAGGPPVPRAERTIPLCHALWAHPALRRRQRREEQDKGGR